MPTLVLSQLGLEGDDPLLELHDAGQEFRVQGFGCVGHLLVDADLHRPAMATSSAAMSSLGRPASSASVTSWLKASANCSEVMAYCSFRVSDCGNLSLEDG